MADNDLPKLGLLRKALEEIDEMPYYPGPIPLIQVEGLRDRYHKALDLARSALSQVETKCEG